MLPKRNFKTQAITNTITKNIKFLQIHKKCLIKKVKYVQKQDWYITVIFYNNFTLIRKVNEYIYNENCWAEQQGIIITRT